MRRQAQVGERTTGRTMSGWVGSQAGRQLQSQRSGGCSRTTADAFTAAVAAQAAAAAGQRPSHVSSSAGTNGAPTIHRQLSGRLWNAASPRAADSFPTHSRSSYVSTTRPRTAGKQGGREMQGVQAAWGTSRWEVLPFKCRQVLRTCAGRAASPSCCRHCQLTSSGGHLSEVCRHHCGGDANPHTHDDATDHQPPAPAAVGSSWQQQPPGLWPWSAAHPRDRVTSSRGQASHSRQAAS